MAVPVIRDLCRTLRSVISLQRQLVSSRIVCTHNLQESNKNVSGRRWLSSDVGSSKVSAESDVSATEPPDYTDIQDQVSEERTTFDPNLVEKLLLEQQSDLPLADMESPYKQPRRRCILCKYDVELDYKNVQLLSQFVSPYTGRIYGHHITGLCVPMQSRVTQLINRARNAGFMAFMLKDTVYLPDPKLFDPFRPGSQKQYH